MTLLVSVQEYKSITILLKNQYWCTQKHMITSIAKPLQIKMDKKYRIGDNHHGEQSLIITKFGNNLKTNWTVWN